MIEKEMIEIVFQKLVEVYHPKEMYLFGSYAWGEPNEDSDLDILVVVDYSNEKPYKRLKPGYVALRGLGIPKDILVYTAHEFDRQSMEISTLAYKIKNEGIKLYETA